MIFILLFIFGLMKVIFATKIFKDRMVGARSEKTHIQKQTSHQTKYTLISCISAFGVVHSKLYETQKAGINSNRFIDFLEELIPLLPPNSVVYLDNAKIHKTDAVLMFLEGMQVNYRFLSPYSPEYNPIELLFGWIKRRIAGVGGDKVREAVSKALQEVTPELLQSWYRRAKYFWDLDEV